MFPSLCSRARLGIIHFFGIEQSLMGKVEFFIGQETGPVKLDAPTMPIRGRNRSNNEACDPLSP